MSDTVELDRRRVLARRFALHGLVERSSGPVGALRVLRLGVQDSPPGSLPLALAARAEAVDLTGLTMIWSHRGAPHLHPTERLPALAAACRPVSEADAAARLGWQRKRLAEIGIPVTEAIGVVAEAMAAVLAAGPRVKGELSAEVTARVPAELSPWCGPCGAHHVAEQLFRLAGLPAGAALRPGTTPVVLEAVPGWPGPPAEGVPTPVVQAYLELFAPGSAADVAGFVGTAVGAVRPFLPADLVPAVVEGRAGLCPPAEVPEIEVAEPVGAVRLLPPSDPYLQGRDREVLVPDKAHRAAIWRPIGSPGVVAVDGEVTGVWRTRRRGRVLELTVEPFHPHTARERAAVEAEAERVRAVRGVPSVAVAGW
jgi:hypothetical protein